jgi:hypothetical protein
MAIGPKDRDWLKAAEARVDDAIVKSLPGESVRVELPNGATAVRAVLLERYRAVGWAHLVYEYGDQREGGTYLVLAQHAPGTVLRGGSR